MKITFSGKFLEIEINGQKERLTLDAAEKLRAFIERKLYRQDRAFKRGKKNSGLHGVK